MEINIFADTICGWCYIGHKNLNTALKKFPNVKFEIKHIPFQLNPDMPNEGISRDKYLQIKFGGKKFADPMYENMKLKAKESGMTFNLDKSLNENEIALHRVNTFDHAYENDFGYDLKKSRSFALGYDAMLLAFAKSHQLSGEIRGFNAIYQLSSSEIKAKSYLN